MKTGTPQNRYQINVKKADHVLDIGGGHNPHPRANVVVDKYDASDNTHRSGNVYVYNNQTFICADGESLPFKDNEFDYSTCCHVLEHVDDPISFVNEVARVSPRGYMETPSLLGEYLIPKDSHKWLIQDVDGKLVMYDKEVIGFKPQQDFGDFFLDYLPRHSMGYKIMCRTHPTFLTNNYEWKDGIEVLVNPQEQYYYDIFTKPWSKEVYGRFFEPHSMAQEARNTLSALGDIIKTVFKSKVLKKEMDREE
jgi:SAM-dependent methyltransferase